MEPQLVARGQPGRKGCGPQKTRGRGSWIAGVPSKVCRAWLNVPVPLGLERQLGQAWLLNVLLETQVWFPASTSGTAKGKPGTSSGHCLRFTDQTAAPAWARAKRCQVRWTDNVDTLHSSSGPGETSYGRPHPRPGPSALSRDGSTERLESVLPVLLSP